MKQLDTSFLNGMRFVFAVWVALGHFFDYAGGSNNPYVDQLLLNPDPAVNGFMIITGFLMTYHYLLRSGQENPSERRTFAYFWLRRLFRLYPVYLLCIVAAYAYYERNTSLLASNYAYFTGLSYEASGMLRPSPGIGSLFGHLTFLHGFVPGMNVDLLAPAWSLATEVQFYWLFPFLFLFLFGNERRMNYRVTFLIVAAVVLERASLKLLGVWDEGLLMTFQAPSLLVYKLNFFMLGIVMAGVALKKIGKPHLWICVLLTVSFQDFVTSMIIVAMTAMLFSRAGRGYFYPYLHRALSAIKALLSFRIAAFGADISYSLYLSHMLVFPTVVWHTRRLGLDGKTETLAVAFGAFLAVNFLLCYLVFVLVEKPFIKLGKSVLRGRPGAKRRPNVEDTKSA